MIFFVLVLVFAVLVIRPFITTILSAMLVTYIFYPLYHKIDSYIKMPNLSAIACTILVFFIIAVPLVIFITSLSSDVSELYFQSKQFISTEDGINSIQSAQDGIVNYISASPRLSYYLENFVNEGSSFLMKYSSTIILSIPRILLNLIIFIFLLFFMFRDGSSLVKRFYKALPLKEGFKNNLKKQTGDVVFATVYGNVVIALIQGIIGSIAFALFGLSSPILWGFLIFILALMPFIGAGLVWIPTVIILFFRAYATGDSSLILPAFGMIFAGLLMSGIDVILKPKVIGKRANIHPAFIVLGIFGGVALMGFVGFFVGPVILALFMSFLKVFESGKDEIIC